MVDGEYSARKQDSFGRPIVVLQHSPLANRFLGSLPGSGSFHSAAEADEARLIATSRCGNAEAYGALVRKYQHRLCSALMPICGSSADAQDAAQEAFLRAYLKLDSFTGASAFYTWLYRIAVNVAISEHRRRRFPPPGGRLSTSGQEPTDRAEAVDENLLRIERAAQVQRALARLSDEHRTILVLREIESLDYDQIAEVLELPVGTVRSRLHRARMQLRQELLTVMGESRGHHECH
jgi:RNA polymerase sigma-70 factor, ECF subfamily